jgi:CHASE4 domain
MSKAESDSRERISARPADALRRLAVLVASIQILVLIVLVSVIFIASEVMNRSALQAQVALIDNAISKVVTGVSHEQKSVAFWDESAKKFKPGFNDRNWANVEIGRFLTETYGHTELYILSPENKPIYAYVNGAPAEPKSYLKHTALFETLVKDIRAGGPDKSTNLKQNGFREFSTLDLSLSPKTEFATGTIVTINGVPSVLSAIVISPNVDMTLSREVPYLLISIVPITQKTFDRIGASLLIPDLKLMPVTNGQSAHGIKPLIADDGSIPAELVWTVPQPGSILLTSILPLVLIAALIAGAFVRALLRRLVRASEELTQREASARHQSLHDRLSGLPNRTYFLDTLAASLKASG